MRVRLLVALFTVTSACGTDAASRIADAPPPDADVADAADRSDASVADASLASDADVADAPPDAGIDGSPGSVSLQVTVGGAGAGTVTSSPAGISCTTGSCAADFETDTVVTLSAAPSTGSTFAGWSGACTGTGACEVTMTEARSVTATFAVMTLTLEVTKSGDGAGNVTGNGLDCSSGTCSVTLPYGTEVVLTATPSSDDATASTFTGWSGVGCSGTGQCTFTITSDRSFGAPFKLKPNLMFTTSATYDGNLGGLAGADAKCQAAAKANGLKGNYLAYLGATGVAAPSRFSPASGWIRVDGAAMINAIGELGTVTLPHAPSLDEAGNDLALSAQVRVWTATAADTSYAGQNCNDEGRVGDWSTTTGRTTTGVLNATDAGVLIGGSLLACGSAVHLYCFGVDRAATVP